MCIGYGIKSNNFRMNLACFFSCYFYCTKAAALVFNIDRTLMGVDAAKERELNQVTLTVYKMKKKMLYSFKHLGQRIKT